MRTFLVKAHRSTRLLVLAFLLTVPTILRAGQVVCVASSDDDAPGGPAVLRIDPTGEVSPAMVLPEKFVAVGLAADASGNLYASGYGKDQVVKISAAGTTVTNLAAGPAGLQRRHEKSTANPPQGSPRRTHNVCR